VTRIELATAGLPATIYKTRQGKVLIVEGDPSEIERLERLLKERRTQVDRDEWPIHQPRAYDAPIPGTHWYAGCEPGGDFDPERGQYEGSGPPVDPATCRCVGCNEVACGICGREGCPDHAYFSWDGWDSGEDVEPPEPGKEWLTVRENGEELAVIVHRQVEDALLDRHGRIAKRERAVRIVAVLNAAARRGEWS
jgi:hypothetical protein